MILSCCRVYCFQICLTDLSASVKSKAIPGPALQFSLWAVWCSSAELCLDCDILSSIWFILGTLYYLLCSSCSSNHLCSSLLMAATRLCAVLSLSIPSQPTMMLNLFSTYILCCISCSRSSSSLPIWLWQSVIIPLNILSQFFPLTIALAHLSILFFHFAVPDFIKLIYLCIVWYHLRHLTGQLILCSFVICVRPFSVNYISSVVCNLFCYFLGSNYAAQIPIIPPIQVSRSVIGYFRLLGAD